MGITGDLKGDGFQNGGVLIVDKDGKQIFEYKQEDAADSISVEKIMKALDLPMPATPAVTSTSTSEESK